MAKKKKQTVALGAVIARGLVQRFITREITKANKSPTTTRGYVAGLMAVRVWLRDQKNRTDRPGGIGR